MHSFSQLHPDRAKGNPHLKHASASAVLVQRQAQGLHLSAVVRHSHFAHKGESHLEM